jgi:hypothetical protein
VRRNERNVNDVSMKRRKKKRSETKKEGLYIFF